MIARGWMACIMLAVGLAVVPIVDASFYTQYLAEVIVTVQVGLHVMGYDPGPIDGFGGPRTRAALRVYAKDRGIVLNQATLDLVLMLLQAEAYEPLLNGGETVGPECLVPGGEAWMLPIEQW